MGQWLKAIGGYSVEQIDFYPSGMTAVAIASTLICATWTDRSQMRWPVLVYMSIAVLIAAVCILVWSSPTGLKFFAYYLAGASYAGQATTFAWANQICADDDQERGIVLASMNMWNNVINAWWPLVFYPATDAPRFRKGMFAMIGTAIATLAVTALTWALERREKRQRGQSVPPGDSRMHEPEGGALGRSPSDSLDKSNEHDAATSSRDPEKNWGNEKAPSRPYTQDTRDVGPGGGDGEDAEKATHDEVAAGNLSAANLQASPASGSHGAVSRG
ncbi:hypothetical protein HGRIS_009703 [Hohenbuehelia grisea]|uniref:Uncharacterized protein n=1 Tax=Hohenbuehelia grisea TaxID=104357 RepID=A0ABR3J2H1_9AGAR